MKQPTREQLESVRRGSWQTEYELRVEWQRQHGGPEGQRFALDADVCRVIHLADVDGLTVPEIASELGISQPAARTAVKRIGNIDLRAVRERNGWRYFWWDVPIGEVE